MEDKINLEPGYYKDISFQDYLLIDAINHSELKKFADDTPYHYKYRKDNDMEKQKDAFDEGRMIHAAVLEPKRFERDFIHTPKSWKDYEKFLTEESIKKLEKDPNRMHDKRTKEFKAIDAIFQSDFETRKEKNPNLRQLDYLLYWKTQEIRKNILGNRIGKSMINESETEFTIIWIDEVTGLKCKGRIDMANEGKLYISDLKKTKSANPYSFWRDARKYNYDSQLAFYWDGAIQSGLMKEIKYFMFLAVEDFKPFFVQPFLIKKDTIFPYSELTWLERGRDFYRDKIEKLSFCKETGEWKGYHDPVNNSYDLFELSIENIG